jgi:hypothetical protein
MAERRAQAGSDVRPRVAGPPDFVGVGALNSGARWWHDLLLQHPGVERRRRGKRELRFFEQFCTRQMTEADVAAYHSHFPRRFGGLTGEWTPRYMYDSWTPLLLRRAAPEARLLVLVSDPIGLYTSRLGLCRSDAAGRARFAFQLNCLLKQFDRSNVLVQQYERCRLDPQGEYERMLHFLGLDDFRLSLAGRGFPGLYRRARGLASRARRRLRRGAPGTVVLWPDLEQALLVALEPEVRELKRLVPELDLGLWPRFAHLTP